MTEHGDKEQVVVALREMGQLLRLKGESAYRARAYETASDRLAQFQGDLDELVRRGRLTDLPGIGDALAARITEIVQTGRSESLEALRREYPPAEQFLLGNVLPRAQELVRRLSRTRGVSSAEIAGTVRRCCEEVERLDLVVAASDVRPILEVVGGPADAREQAPGRFSFRVLPDGLPVNLRVIPPDNPMTFAATWYVETGSPAHVKKLRDLARARGLDLETLLAQNESALLGALGLPFIPPELREDDGEIEAALSGTLPADLVTLEDIAGVVHSHSTWSDGKASLEEMALAARDRGLRYLTVTEHSQSAGYAGGLRQEDLRRQWEEIERLNRGFGDPFTLLRGIESDILADGALDYPDSMLGELEVVIGSVHQRHKMDRAEMTRRILHAFDNPHLHILGHATGRLLQRRPPAPLDMDEIFDVAARAGVVVEVNGSPHRLDLKASHVRKALAKGVKLVVSADSHSTGDLANLEFAVATARRGWARRGDVLNTREAREFTSSLRALRSEHR